MGQIYKLFQFKCKFLYFKSNFSFLMVKIDIESRSGFLKNSWSINGNDMFKNAIFAQSKR